MTINIIVLNNENRREINRKGIKRSLPVELQEALAGLDVDIENNEEVKEKQPRGFPRKFSVPEEVLFFNTEQEETEEDEEPSPVLERNRRTRKKLNRRPTA